MLVLRKKKAWLISTRLPPDVPVKSRKYPRVWKTTGLANPARTIYKAAMTDFAKPILAFDTALNGCVVCILAGDKPVTRVFPTDREQAAKLVPLIQGAMAEAGVAFADLGLIVTSVGPGSFTGLRIGLSTARSFGLALDIPVHGVSTLAMMAASCKHEGDTKRSLVLLETKRSDYYVQGFDINLTPLREAGSASLEDILACNMDDTIFCGNAVGRFVEEVGATPKKAILRERDLLDPVILAREGLKDFAAKGFVTVKPEPVYLRGADVSVSKKIQREINEMPL